MYLTKIHEINLIHHLIILVICALVPFGIYHVPVYDFFVCSQLIIQSVLADRKGQMVAYFKLAFNHSHA